jgi:hypothetical protein
VWQIFIPEHLWKKLQQKVKLNLTE